MDDALERKAKIFINIKNITEALIGEAGIGMADDIAAKTRELFDEFNDLLSNVRTQLMSEEITLHDQLKVRACDITSILKKYRGSAW